MAVDSVCGNGGTADADAAAESGASETRGVAGGFGQIPCPLFATDCVGWSVPMADQLRRRCSTVSPSIVMDEVGQPFTAAPGSFHFCCRGRRLSAVSPNFRQFSQVLCGYVAFLGDNVSSWWIRWLRIRAAVRAGSPVSIELPIAALSSPTPVGTRRLRRLPAECCCCPTAYSTGLSPAQLQAVVAHELCHVRNRDNLTAAVHMFVETVFWFHPLVWWIGKRMVEERERACDEEVLRVFTEPRIYADAILSVCRLYTESPLRCASGVSGASLRKRIEAIMINRKMRELNSARRAALCAAGLMAIAIPVIVGIANAPAIRAQTGPASHRQFEVASIRPSKDCGLALGFPPPPSGSAKKTGNGPAPSPVRMNACGTLEQLIRRASPCSPIPAPMEMRCRSRGARPGSGPNPPSIRSRRNRVAPASQDMMHGPMMQSLLEDRFKLKIRRETREGPAYALTVAPGGSKLPRFKEGNCTPYTFPPPTLAAGQEFCAESMGRNGTEATVYRQGIDLDTFATFLFVMTDRPCHQQNRARREVRYSSGIYTR